MLQTGKQLAERNGGMQSNSEKGPSLALPFVNTLQLIPG